MRAMAGDGSGPNCICCSAPRMSHSLAAAGEELFACVLLTCMQSFEQHRLMALLLLILVFRLI